MRTRPGAVDLALFDFDGTLTTVDTFSPFVSRMMPWQRKLLFGALLLPVLVGYRVGLIRASWARPLVARIAFCGRSAQAMRDAGQRYAADVLPGVMREAALETLRAHKRRGDVVVVVSASLDVYLEPWCLAQGADLLCTRLEERDGTLTGRLAGGDCAGLEKARRVQRTYDLARFRAIHAYGDTEEDLPMLDLADCRYYRGQPLHPDRDTAGPSGALHRRRGDSTEQARGR